MNQENMLVNNDLKIPEERVKEIFSAEGTKRLWKEMIEMPNFKKMAEQSENFVQMIQAAIIQDAIELVVVKGVNFNEAVQKRILYCKEKMF